MARLQTIAGPFGTPAYELTGKFITIGRAHGNTIHLNHRSVSKYHALLVVEDDQVQIFDLHSTNGTFLNGQHTATCPLQPNDEILIGEFLFRYERADVPVPAPTPRPVVAPAAQPVQQTITADIAKKLAVPTPRVTTGSIKPSPSPDRSFIRLPGQTPADPKPSLVEKLLKRDTSNVPPKSAPAPTPVAAPLPVTPATPPAVAPTPEPAPVAPEPAPTAPEPIIPAAPAAPAASPLVPGPSGGAEKGDGLLLKKPGAAGGDRLLIKRGGSGAGDRLIKKPAAPKD